MLTVFALCGILGLVGCKNGYKSIKESKNNENADKLLEANNSLIENHSNKYI